MSYGKKFAGMGTFDEAVNDHGKPRPGFLKCHGCRAEFDPNKGRIRSREVRAAYCNDCLEGNFAAGRWQEVFKYEAAKQGGS